MKLKMVGIMLTLSLLLVLAGAALAAGHTAGQLSNAGWACFPAGPHGWTHCTPPGKSIPTLPETVQVKVFGDGGSHFLGTEILVRADIYNDQPCMTDGGGLYDDLSGEGLPYFACHHFDTDH
jgi:hypothetical protein